MTRHELPTGGEFAAKVAEDLQTFQQGGTPAESEKTRPLYDWLASKLAPVASRPFVDVERALGELRLEYDAAARRVTRERDAELARVTRTLGARAAARYRAAGVRAGDPKAARILSAVRGAITREQNTIRALARHELASLRGRLGNSVKSVRRRAAEARPYSRLVIDLDLTDSHAKRGEEYRDAVEHAVPIPAGDDVLDQLIGSNGYLWLALRPLMRQRSPYVWTVAALTLDAGPAPEPPSPDRKSERAEKNAGR